MKIKLSLLFIFFCSLASAQSYKKIHRKALLADTHNDILSKVVETGVAMDSDLTGRTHRDLARWKKGGLDLQLFSVWSDGDRAHPFSYAMRQMDSLDAVIKRNPTLIAKAANSKEIYQIT